ncbi:MAG: metallophosphoesterase [Micromonosporaceae bacterium]
MLLAHMSDLHLDGSVRARERTARVMTYLDGLDDLDAVLVTGDLTDHGAEAEYEELMKLLPSRHPVLTCPGNHDVRAAYRTVVLGEDAADAPVNQVHRIGGAVFAMCDSTIPGRPDGALSGETLDWLAGALADTAGEPVFVGFHHPPMPLGNPYVDELRLHGEHQLAALVAAYPQVVAVLCGHAHTAAVTRFAGVPLLVAPGIASTITLPWEHRDLYDHELPPGIAFHVVGEDRRLTTHYRFL